MSVDPVKEQSDIPLDYTTVKATGSRMGKGLLAIPVSLVYLFPKDTRKIYLLDESGNRVEKTFTPYSSSSRECRINGLGKFYAEFSIKDGDELVIQKIDDDTFRLLPEPVFREKYLSALSMFEHSEDEEAVQKTLFEAEKIANVNADTILLNAFVQLSNIEFIPQRQMIDVNSQSRRENIPPSLRKILLSIYNGRCQITNFTFLTKTGNPYFEVHHIRPHIGNHIKNLLVVCPNIHAQFTYANSPVPEPDADGWVRTVMVNGEQLNVFQKIDKIRQTFTKEVHFT